jgi:HK97 family phage major capsid protein
MELESKALGGAPEREIKDAFDDFMRSFEAFKQANDERLGELEKRASDAVTTEKVDRINAALDEQKHALDELVLAGQRPALATSANQPANREHKTAFERYVRKGDAGGLDRFEMKASPLTKAAPSCSANSLATSPHRGR